jgi:hypothetical protein
MKFRNACVCVFIILSCGVLARSFAGAEVLTTITEACKSTDNQYDLKSMASGYTPSYGIDPYPKGTRVVQHCTFVRKNDTPLGASAAFRAICPSNYKIVMPGYSLNTPNNTAPASMTSMATIQGADGSSPVDFIVSPAPGNAPPNELTTYLLCEKSI